MAATDPYKVPNAPVRDDEALSPDEDLDREPDGVPHSTVGFTAFFSVLLAMLVAFMVLSGNRVTQGAAVVLLLVAIPILVKTLNHQAEDRRDHLHPSR